MELTEIFEWHGRTIACRRAGRGPAVVFCHGTPFSSRVWAPYADALSDEYSVHLWDMPGYGRSSQHADHAVDIGVQAQAFAALLRHWDLDAPHVVAHDIGGAVSLRATLTESASYASILLVDVVAIPPAGSPFFRFVREHPGVLDGLPTYVHEAILDAYVRRASHGGLRDEDVAALCAPWTGEVGQAAFYRQITSFDERFLVGIESRLASLRLPVRIVWGADDAWVPLAAGRRLAGLVPAATLVEVPDAGHLIHYDAPVALANELRTWLDAQPR